jgi:hypothetical protein
MGLDDDGNGSPLIQLGSQRVRGSMIMNHAYNRSATFSGNAKCSRDGTRWMATVLPANNAVVGNERWRALTVSKTRCQPGLPRRYTSPRRYLLRVDEPRPRRYFLQNRTGTRTKAFFSPSCAASQRIVAAHLFDDRLLRNLPSWRK